MKVKMGFLIESMARDMRHPYIPSTTVLGDIGMGPMPAIVDVWGYDGQYSSCSFLLLLLLVRHP